MKTTKADLVSMLKFAQLHDWGKNAFLATGSEALHIWDEYECQIVLHHDMQSLKTWAGY